MVVDTEAKLQTAVSVISYICTIEQASGALYEQLAPRFTGLRETFYDFLKENRKFESAVKRAYFNVISDALETAFCFDLAVDRMLTTP